jgi:hypothetical protein
MKKIIRLCSYCGKRIKRFPSAFRSEKSFCNHSCQTRLLNKVKNPSWTRDLKGEKNPMFGKHPKAWNKGLIGERSHSWKGPTKRKDGYVRFNENGVRKLYHRYLLEKLGIDLKGKTVHHKDHDPSNNSLENLVVFESQSDHVKYAHGKRNRTLVTS